MAAGVNDPSRARSALSVQQALWHYAHYKFANALLRTHSGLGEALNNMLARNARSRGRSHGRRHMARALPRACAILARRASVAHPAVRTEHGRRAVRVPEEGAQPEPLHEPPEVHPRRRRRVEGTCPLLPAEPPSD